MDSIVSIKQTDAEEKKKKAEESVRRNLDFYAEISEATVKNDNKKQKKNLYGKGKDSKNKVNPD